MRSLALLCDIAIAVLADLTGVVRSRATGIALHFNDCLPVRKASNCEPQIFAFRLAGLYFRVHVSDFKPKEGEHLLGCGNQVVAVGPEDSSDPLICLLRFLGQFRLKLISFVAETLNIRSELCEI